MKVVKERKREWDCEQKREQDKIRLVTYNIRSGRSGGLEAALRAMAQANVDLGVFQETKLTDDIYARMSSG